MSNVAETSRDALGKISLSRQKTQGDLVEAVVRQAIARGAADVSLQELKKMLAHDYDTQMDLSIISRIVHGLVTSKRLVRNHTNRRPCTVSGVSIAPISLPQTQTRMFN